MPGRLLLSRHGECVYMLVARTLLIRQSLHSSHYISHRITMAFSPRKSLRYSWEWSSKRKGRRNRSTRPSKGLWRKCSPKQVREWKKVSFNEYSFYFQSSFLILSQFSSSFTLTDKDKNGNVSFAEFVSFVKEYSNRYSNPFIHTKDIQFSHTKQTKFFHLLPLEHKTHSLCLVLFPHLNSVSHILFLSVKHNSLCLPPHSLSNTNQM